jgi:hypothetical protein
MTVVVNKLEVCVVIIVNSWNASFGKMLNKPNKWLKLKEKHLNRAKMHHNGLGEPIDDVSKRLVVN